MQTWRYALLGLAVVASAQQQKGMNFYSVDKELAMGKQLAQQANSQVTPLNNAAVSAYVDRITRELAAQIPNPPYPCVVTVVKDGVGAEPTTLPGGYLYVSASQISQAHSESEFVGLLAHAMAHSADRDPTRIATRGELAQIAAMPIRFVGNATPRQDLSQPFAITAFTRQYETEADELAVKTMAAAGFYPADLAQYVERTAKNDGAPGWDSFQQTRLTQLRREAAKVTVSPSSDGLEFARVQAIAGN
jgi:predicted Zn-dependent protease